ncbi:unnamed protein product [Zymoseptoria tritici ST99CH_1A5]|uniref:Uncharacterized protein n=1 Tax=Zymoseptoria tritici ST99CH_1A5 TaxID=1276529 RepID=A0A1Y6M049_ZYMTR|nr:unnamed protein product [Zymoseptoria tritici ST99CH_1A5]
MSKTQCTLLDNLPRELRDEFYLFAANDFLAIDVCASKETQSPAVKCIESLGATCHQIRDEVYDRFFKNNTFVIFMQKDDITDVDAALLKRVRRVTIEPYWDEIAPIVLSRSDNGWEVEESHEYFEENEWLSMIKDENIEAVLDAVKAILADGAEDGFTVECVNKIRRAQQSVLEERRDFDGNVVDNRW